MSYQHLIIKHRMQPVSYTHLDVYKRQDGKVYTLSGYEGEEYLQKVAAYINNKIIEFDAIEDYRHLPLNMKNTLIQLNIADDYFKAKDQVTKLENDLEQKEKEIYDLKHDLISNQVKTETAEASLKELEAANKELLLNKACLLYTSQYCGQFSAALCSEMHSA